MGKLRVYCLKALNKLSIYPLGNTPSAPSVTKLRVQPHIHHRDPPLLLPINQWRYECAPPFVILTHMMSLIRQLIPIYSSWFVICVVTVHGLCMRPALY